VPFSNYLDKAILQYFFQGAAFTLPADLYVALSTTTPVQGASSNFTEPSGNGYARVAVALNSTNFVAVGTEPAGGYSLQNGTVITFPQPTGNWGTVTYAGLFDAASAGNFWGFGQLTTALTITSTSAPPSFAVGALIITND
jgi:hypothetical protein